MIGIEYIPVNIKPKEYIANDLLLLEYCSDEGNNWSTIPTENNIIRQSIRPLECGAIAQNRKMKIKVLHKLLIIFLSVNILRHNNEVMKAIRTFIEQTAMCDIPNTLNHSVSRKLCSGW